MVLLIILNTIKSVNISSKLNLYFWPSNEASSMLTRYIEIFKSNSCWYINILFFSKLVYFKVYVFIMEKKLITCLSERFVNFGNLSKTKSQNEMCNSNKVTRFGFVVDLSLNVTGPLTGWTAMSSLELFYVIHLGLLSCL